MQPNIITIMNTHQNKNLSSIPLVFLHGFPFNGSCWLGQLEHFKNRPTILAPDLRGHGHGPNGPGPWTIADFVKDLKITLAEKNINKFILCGLSLGGYIALEFVNNFPDQIEALILCDTHANADSEEAKSKRIETISDIQKNGLKDFAASFSTKVLSEVTLKAKPQMQKYLEAIILSNDPDDVIKVLGALASRKDFNHGLHTIKFPTLVVVGADDKITPPELNEALARNIPGAQFKIIANAGHLPNMEQPTEFNSILDAFISENLSKIY